LGGAIQTSLRSIIATPSSAKLFAPKVIAFPTPEPSGQKFFGYFFSKK
jgi:hypothetical protein